MQAPRFLSVENVLALHADTVAHEGGSAGVRDLGLLTAAAMMPRQTFGGRYLHGDLPTMAAACAFHIVRNHALADGNKRTGAMAAFVFLDANGIDLTARPNELAEAIRAVADGSLSKADLAAWFRRHTRRRAR